MNLLEDSVMTAAVRSFLPSIIGHEMILYPHGRSKNTAGFTVRKSFLHCPDYPEIENYAILSGRVYGQARHR